ncbi:hypothetical protein PoB_005395000 [Plakobranchus ocellatus]|uniref:Uncharacterized protein n=1 Tax=Plakobranchus ocellatus TaxID=259542 RepID=A0AAV4C441_9GAST|nr:hypothetical protein PoB_005395000 [Plakobranchus ocellatus]
MATLNRASCSAKLICWSDLKPKVNAYTHTVWQENWDAEGTNKYEILPNLSEDLSKRGDGTGKKRETVMCRLRIFKHASVRARIRDNALQSVQKALTKGLTAITLVLDQLKEDKDSDILEKVADGVALISDASHSLDLFRRQAFKGELKEEYNSLCSGVYPATDSLFGPDINEKIKSVNKSMRVAKNIRKFQPYNKNARRFPFLGQRHHWKSRGGGSNTGHKPQRNHWQPYKRQFPKKKI